MGTYSTFSIVKKFPTFSFWLLIIFIFLLLPNGAGGKKTEELSKYFAYAHTKTIRSSFLPPAPVLLFHIFFDKR